MRNKYLLLGAASAMMLAACSEDINNGPEATRPVENALNLTSLDAASQAGRVSLPGQTRGTKSSRLQLVAKIAPVADAAANNWSATGLAIANNNVYVSWHSNRQAATNATAWGGAIDVLSIDALKPLEGAINPANVFISTQVSSTAKFNGITAADGVFYLPITSYNYGAAVGRWTPGAAVVDTINVPGVSANCIAVRGNDVYAVTGYKGGLYSFPAADFGAEARTGITENIAFSPTFGGKYIAGDYVLRTDDNAMEILPISGGQARFTGEPLKSQVKFAETYDPETNQWVLVEGTDAAHYGKHTMAVDGNTFYVGGGVAEGGNNGLRVYTGTKEWSNGTSTTAVTVATVGDKKLVFAATDAGLRVYEPFDGNEMPLFAFEVYQYNGKGEATGGKDEPNADAHPVAGTQAHSCNFVAVDSASGLVFVANGQSGVYVFKLDTTVVVPTFPTGFQQGNNLYTEEVAEGETGKVTTPEAPETEEGVDFVGWKGDDGKDYEPNTEYELEAGKIVKLTPVTKPHEYKYTLKFNPWLGKESEITNVPAELKSDTNEFIIPDVTPVWGERKFWGWYTEAEWYEFDDPSVIKIGDKFSIPGDASEFTLYGVWSSRLEGGAGTVEPEPEPEPDPDPVIGGEDTNGKE